MNIHDRDFNLDDVEDLLIDALDVEDFDLDADGRVRKLDDDDDKTDGFPIKELGDPSRGLTLEGTPRNAEEFQEWLKKDTLRLQQSLRNRGIDPGYSQRIREQVWAERDEKRAKLKAAYKELREAVGRGGMREGDLLDATFIPYPVQFWTMKELKNRLAWLKKERGWLLGKPDKKRELGRNANKIQRYTRELFQRYSPEGLKQTRAEFNRLRRSRRRIAKQRKIARMMKTWKEKKRAERAAYKSLANKDESKPPTCS